MNSVIVVEGLHDASKIKEVYPNSHVIVTGGTALSDALIDELKELSKTNEIILFLDPDYPGNSIRRILSTHLPNVKHAHIKRSLATKGRKVGIEHASTQAIKEALNIRDVVHKTDITKAFLVSHGYIGQHHSKEKRMALLNNFNIGYVNGKGLVSKLSLFGIQQSEVMAYESKEALRTKLSKK